MSDRTLIIAALIVFFTALTVIVPFFLLLTRPLYRRLAIRQITRRPRETLLILLGSLFGTALIVCSLVVGDSLRASIHQSAFTQLGPLDEIVRTKDLSTSQEVFNRIAKSSLIDGVLPATVGTGSVQSQNAQRLAEPSVQLIELDYSQAKGFGGDAKSTGISGVTPSADEVDISSDLAGRISARVGQHISLNYYGQEKVFGIRQILPRRGLAGLLRTDESQSDAISLNVFLPKNTMPQSNSAVSSVVFVSNQGGTTEGAQRSNAVTHLLRCDLGLPDACPIVKSPVSSEVSIDQIKSSLLKTADDSGKGFTQIFSALSAFSVVAGIFLLVTVLVMLAQDRKTQHGIMRAVGMTGSSLSSTFFLESWLYSLASAVLGSLFGMLIGRLVVASTHSLFQNTGGAFALDIVYSASLRSIAIGFAIGVSVASVTILLVAWWLSHLNIIRAIRDLPDVRARSTSLYPVLVGMSLAILGFTGLEIAVQKNNATGLILGPSLLAIGLYLTFKNIFPARLFQSLCSAGLLFWTICGAYWVYPDIIKDIQVTFFVASGLVVVFAAIIFVAVNQLTFAAIVGRIAGKNNLATRIGFAYPNARRLRTGLILGMYSMVVFAIGFITIYSVLFSEQVTEFTKSFSSGYDILVDGNASTPFVSSDFESIAGVSGVSFLSNGSLEFRVKPTDSYSDWQTVGFFDDSVKFDVDKRLSEYASDNDARLALVNQPNTVAVDERFLQRSRGPSFNNAPLGSTIEARSPITGRAVNLKVVAAPAVTFGESSALVGAPTLSELNGSVPTNRAYVRVQTKSSAAAIAKIIQSKLIVKGARAQTFRAVVNSGVKTQVQLFQLFQGYIGLGLLIGMAGLGVVSIRSVRERRRQIGMLRAMGFTTDAVRRIFEVESAFVALEGILIGLIIASVLVWRLDSSQAFGGSLGFHVPWVPLIVLGSVSLFAALIATAVPASRASKIAPAEALRLVD